jgi:hypothetical protein
MTPKPSCHGCPTVESSNRLEISACPGHRRHQAQARRSWRGSSGRQSTGNFPLKAAGSASVRAFSRWGRCDWTSGPKQAEFAPRKRRERLGRHRPGAGLPRHRRRGRRADHGRHFRLSLARQRHGDSTVPTLFPCCPPKPNWRTPDRNGVFPRGPGGSLYSACPSRLPSAPSSPGAGEKGEGIKTSRQLGKPAARSERCKHGVLRSRSAYAPSGGACGPAAKR